MGDTFAPMKKTENVETSQPPIVETSQPPMEDQMIDSNQNRVAVPPNEQNNTCMIGKVSTQTVKLRTNPSRKAKKSAKVAKKLSIRKLRSRKVTAVNKRSKSASRKVKVASRKAKAASKSAKAKKIKARKGGKAVAKKANKVARSRLQTKTKAAKKGALKKRQRSASTNKSRTRATLASTLKRQKQARAQRQNKVRGIKEAKNALGRRPKAGCLVENLEIVPNSLQSVNLKTYMRKLLRNNNRNMAISGDTATQMDNAVKNIMHFLSDRASGMLGRRKTLNEKMLQKAVQMCLPAELRTGADKHAQKALQRFHNKK